MKSWLSTIYPVLCFLWVLWLFLDEHKDSTGILKLTIAFYVLTINDCFPDCVTVCSCGMPLFI